MRDPRACAARRRRRSVSAVLVVVRVDLDVLLPLVGELVLGEARVDGQASTHASQSMHSSGIDVEHLDVVVVGLVGRRDGCSRPGRPRRTSCPWCRCRARRSRRPCVSDSSTRLQVRMPARRGGGVRILGDRRSLASRSRVASRRCCCSPVPPEPSGARCCAPLIDAGTPVRCLVRDPRRLGPDRVRVQIALGDLGDHLSFRHALRGVDTVVHLASVIRDQPHGSIEELSGVATWRLVQAAERAGRAALRLLLHAGRLDAQPRAADARQGGRRARRRGVLARAHGVRALDHLRARATPTCACCSACPGCR